VTIIIVSIVLVDVRFVDSTQAKTEKEGNKRMTELNKQASAYVPAVLHAVVRIPRV
jgi:hypothetical protein